MCNVQCAIQRPAFYWGSCAQWGMLPTLLIVMIGRRSKCSSYFTTLADVTIIILTVIIIFVKISCVIISTIVFILCRSMFAQLETVHYQWHQKELLSNFCKWTFHSVPHSPESAPAFWNTKLLHFTLAFCNAPAEAIEQKDLALRCG